MRLWTVQPEGLYEKLKTEKVLHCDPAQSEWVTECGFGPAYDWISKQMKVRVGPPPKGVIYPFWAWHIVLNDAYYGDCVDKQEMEKEDAWFNNLPPKEQAFVKMKSWEKIFIVSPPYESAWECRGKYVQATFWELRLEQVVAIRRFKGRLH